MWMRLHYGRFKLHADENQTSIGSVVATDPEGEVVSLSVSGSELLTTSDGVLSFVSALIMRPRPAIQPL